MIAAARTFPVAAVVPVEALLGSTPVVLVQTTLVAITSDQYPATVSQMAHCPAVAAPTMHPLGTWLATASQADPSFLRKKVDLQSLHLVTPALSWTFPVSAQLAMT